MLYYTHTHTYTHAQLSLSLSLSLPQKNIPSPNITADSRIPSAPRRWWRVKNRQRYDVVLLATVWWPHQSATQHSSSPCLVSIILTHMHREREWERGLCPLLLLQSTHPTWGMYRDDTTLHISYLQEPNLELDPILTCKPWGNTLLETLSSHPEKDFTFCKCYSTELGKYHNMGITVVLTTDHSDDDSPKTAVRLNSKSGSHFWQVIILNMMYHPEKARERFRHC